MKAALVKEDDDHHISGVTFSAVKFPLIIFTGKMKMQNEKRSAGLLMYCYRDSELEVLLVHPGGPYWAKKDDGIWSIPKGEYSDREDPFEAAKREFQEETGYVAEGNFLALTPRRQPTGKLVSAWAVEGDCDAAAIKSNTFTIEWPPQSGKRAAFAEVDRAEWFSLEQARIKMLKGQVGFIDELFKILQDDSCREEEGG